MAFVDVLANATVTKVETGKYVIEVELPKPEKNDDHILSLVVRQPGVVEHFGAIVHVQ